jgi:hypothetical protein
MVAGLEVTAGCLIFVCQGEGGRCRPLAGAGQPWRVILVVREREGGGGASLEGRGRSGGGAREGVARGSRPGGLTGGGRKVGRKRRK